MSTPAISVSIAPRERPMLVLISDIHLTDELSAPHVAWDEAFARFWGRMEGARRDRPVHLCIVGDFIDVVRSPRWLRGPHRPYHDPDEATAAVVDAIVEATVAREARFFEAIRTQVGRGALVVHCVLGNHDRLLAHAPAARRRLWRALTGEDVEVDFPDRLAFVDHGVIAYHGHTGDFVCSAPDGRAPLSDMFGSELIVRFPIALTERLGERLPHIDDIDDVRPIYAVPSWIRQIGAGHRALMGPVAQTWSALVEEFLEIDHVKDWMRSQPRVAGVSVGGQLQRLLRLSTGRIMASASDKRLTRMFGTMQHLFDGRFAQRAAAALQEPGSAGLRYVVNGHSHFASMTPLGHIGGRQAVYFNSGTWRTLHQIGTHAGGRPTFLPVQAMTYIVFFPDGDPLGRDFEWWTGALVAREEGASPSGTLASGTAPGADVSGSRSRAP